MRSALLIVDLEGVAGVDDLESLVAIAPGFARARTLLGEEVKAAVTGLVAAGFERVVVSDSHRSGLAQPNLRPEGLPRGARLDFREDAYDAALFEGIDAVACLGMHAPAGTAGFAAHTVDVNSTWLTAGRSLSETEIVLGLAALHGVPLVFVAGDDVLQRCLPADLPYVVTKQSLSRAAARSAPPSQVREALALAARRTPVVAPPVAADLQLRLRSRWQTDAALEIGAERVDAYTVRVHGATFREQYGEGLRISQRVARTLKRSVRLFDQGAALQDMRSLLLRPTTPAPPAEHDSEATRVLAAFLRLSAGELSWQRADRALTLHMLEGHAPRFFAAAGLGAVLAEAVAALPLVPSDFAVGLDPVEAMARVDAAYVLRERGLPGALDDRGLAAYLAALPPAAALVAWLLGELAAQIGGPAPRPTPPRARRAVSRVEDLYWLTHLFLLETRYLRRPLPAAGWDAMVEELFLAVPFVRAEGRIDLAAELTFCLQVAGERQSGEHRQLLTLLLAQLAADGVIGEPRVSAATHGAAEAARLEAHRCAAALIALAGARQP